MDKLTISIFENQILYSIINELKLFSKFNVKFYDNFDFSFDYYRSHVVYFEYRYKKLKIHSCSNGSVQKR